MERLDRTFNPHTGVLTDVSAHEVEGKLVIRKQQDIEPYIERATMLRNNDDYWKQGVKQGWAHAATIPPITIVQLMKIGVNVYKAPGREIVAGLKKLGMEHLLTTRARI